MKFISIPILSVILLLLACGKTNSKKTPEMLQTEEEKLKSRYDAAEMSLRFEMEKIYLLAEIKKLNSDTLRLILTEYFAGCPDYLQFSEHFKSTFNETLQKISAKFKIPRSRVAYIIYSFKYEMVTRDEIEQNLREDIDVVSERDDDLEDYDPRH